MVEYNELTDELVAELAAIVGEDNCLTGGDINEDYSHDEMPIYGTHMPDVVVLPANGLGGRQHAVGGRHCAVHHAHGQDSRI